MSLFARQPVHCLRCGVKFLATMETAFSIEGMMGQWCCSPECLNEMRLRAARYVMGKQTEER